MEHKGPCVRHVTARQHCSTSNTQVHAWLVSGRVKEITAPNAAVTNSLGQTNRGTSLVETNRGTNTHAPVIVADASGLPCAVHERCDAGMVCSTALQQPVQCHPHAVWWPAAVGTHRQHLTVRHYTAALTAPPIPKPHENKSSNRCSVPTSAAELVTGQAGKSVVTIHLAAHTRS